MKSSLHLGSASAAGLFLAMLLLAGCESTVPRIMSPGSFTTVVVDAGHGGHDSGERPGAGRQAEKDLALDTAKRVAKLLNEAGLRTVMTRTDDTFVELDERVAIADRIGPSAIFVSIHYNASASYARGLETYYWRPDSQGLATRVQSNMLSESGMPNHGVRRRVLRVTHNTKEPSILCECGYLTNGTDYALATSESYRQKIAEGIADGIVEQHEKGDYDLAVLPPAESYSPPRHAYRQHHVSTRHHGRTSSSKKGASTKSSSKKSSSRKSTTKKSTTKKKKKPAS